MAILRCNHSRLPGHASVGNRFLAQTLAIETNRTKNEPTHVGCYNESADVLDHATSEIASGSKLGIDATKKLTGEGFKREWSPLIKMDAVPFRK